MTPLEHGAFPSWQLQHKGSLSERLAKAYRLGQLQMRDACISRLADYNADKCAQICASVEIV